MKTAAEYKEAYLRGTFIRGAWEVVKEELVVQRRSLEETEGELNVYAFCEMLDRVLPQYAIGGDDTVYNGYDYLLDPQNWVAGDKAVGKGKWIKVKTPTGFQLHFAKRTRALPHNAIKHAIQGFLATQPKRTTELDKAGETERAKLVEFAGEEALSMFKNYDEGKAKIEKAKYDALKSFFTTIMNYTDYRPQFVTIRTSKRKSTYLLPCQYEIASDNSLSLFDHVTRYDALTFKRHFVQVGEEDQIFYLMSRGINRIQAEIMVARQTGFLDVNEQMIYA